MLIPRYWARGESRGTDTAGKPVRITAWGWSSTGPDDARVAANRRAQQAVARLAARESAAGRSADYDSYLEIPLREEIIETLKQNGDEIGVVTRNRYGALVLNAARVLFVDVDHREPRPQGLIDGLKSALSRRNREARTLEAHAETMLRVVEWAAANPSYSFRLYQTRAGLRLLFTNKLFEPVSDEVHDIFRELGTDLLYQRLTIKQDSFRARLTPKPWRIGLTRPLIKYPYASDYARSAMDDWVTKYDDESVKYQVCLLLDQFGAARAAHPEIEQIVAFHDRATRRTPSIPLA